MINELLRLIYHPPVKPTLEMPPLWRIAKIPWDKALEMFYLAGWYDGFLAGVVVAILIMMPKRGRSNG